MTDPLFVPALALLLAALMTWAFRHLPRERWQVLASIPLKKQPDGRWLAANVTSYGVLSGFAYGLAVAMLVVLMAGMGQPPGRIAWLAVVVLGLACPASRIVARVVEKRPATLTVGGAAFVGLLAAPIGVLLIDAALPLVGDDGSAPMPMLPTLAACGVAYALGEGTGRLACISFGCCYGRPVDALPSRLRPLFARRHFVFEGGTKKIAYASGLAGRPVVPIQAVTSVVLVALGLGAAELVRRGEHGAALLLAGGGSQLWRALSETLRCDFRGAGRLTAYQWLALVGAALVPALAFAAARFDGGAPPPTVDVGVGLSALWDPAVLLALQALVLLILVRTGWSRVTGSHVAIHVRDGMA